MHQKKASEETSCGITAWKVSAPGGRNDFMSAVPAVLTLCLKTKANSISVFQLRLLKY